MGITLGYIIFSAITLVGIIVPTGDGMLSSKGISINGLSGIETSDVEVGEMGDDYKENGFEDSDEDDNFTPAFISPVKVNKVRSPFGQRIHPIEKTTKFHDGIDLDGELGDKILASASGVVTFTGLQNGYGNVVIVTHHQEDDESFERSDNEVWTSHYAHLDKIRVKKSARVEAGQLVGEMGQSGTATGIHLHFEIRKDNQPQDPARFISF